MVAYASVLGAGCLLTSDLDRYRRGSPDKEQPDTGAGDASTSALDASTPAQGFGATTPGGAGKPVFRVTNLNAAGPGSLADALSGDNRTIEFGVGGTIDSDEITMAGRQFVTIAGETAPAPGITLTRGGLSIEEGCHDIIVRHIRSRNTKDDAFRVFASHDILFDHVSASGAGAGSLDITEGSYNVTVQWSILSGGASDNMLVSYGAKHVSVHHDLFVGSESPTVTGQAGSKAPASGADLAADVRNNIVWNWGTAGGAGFGMGANVDDSARANVVDNFFEAHGTYPDLVSLAIVLDHQSSGAQVHTKGNVSGNAVDLDARGNVLSEFPALATPEGACVSAARVTSLAGALPRDTVDQGIAAGVSVANCR